MGGSRSGGKGMCWGGGGAVAAGLLPTGKRAFPTFLVGKAGRSPLFSEWEERVVPARSEKTAHAPAPPADTYTHIRQLFGCAKIR